MLFPIVGLIYTVSDDGLDQELGDDKQIEVVQRPIGYLLVDFDRE